MRQQEIIICILDGWGLDRNWGGNAVTLAKTPNYDYLEKYYPHTQLKASGVAVGLPDSARGNSEAGHLNIGAGKVVHQDITIINQDIQDGTFYRNQNLLRAIEWAQKNNSNLHLVGLLSEGGNHSHLSHLFALLDLCKLNRFNRVFLDLFTDGRDSSPESGLEYIKKVENKLKEVGFGWISSVCGRYYAMDRDNRWGRTSRAYNALVNGSGETYLNAEAGVMTSYGNHLTDEFMVPFLTADKEHLKTTIKDSDSIIFFNFRTDRGKQLVEAFVKEYFTGFTDRQLLRNIFFVSFMPFEDNLLVHSAFGPEKVEIPLSLFLSNAKLRQFHIAETEKFAHVTYFFNGQMRQPFPGEDRLLVPSPKVLTYDLAPKMSAAAVTDNLVKKLDEDYQFYLVNFANPDMVGHTGNLAATIQACEEVDRCLGEVIRKAKPMEAFLITCADHGNAEKMMDIYTGEPNTEHTSNPVPFIISDFSVQKKMIELEQGQLCDIAPTLLEYFGFDKPLTMTGRSLIIKQ